MNRTCRRLMLSLLPVLALCCGSCQLIGLIADAANRPETIKARYRPPRDKTLLVFVDDRLIDTDQPLRALLTERLNHLLKANEVVDRTVPFERTLDFAAEKGGLSNIEPGSTAKRVGADMILYVRVDRFSLKDEPVDVLWRGRLEVSINLSDARTAQRLWPRHEPEGLAMDPLETPTVTHPSPTYGADLTRSLAQLMAERIAKLFYDHQVMPSDVWGAPGVPAG